MFITRVFYKVVRYPMRWRESRLKMKAHRKKKAVYSNLEKERMKKLATLLKANQVIQ